MNLEQQQQIYNLNRTFNGINAAYADIAKKYGLNYNSFMVIYNMESMEKCTQKKLCDSLMLSKSTVHSILLSFMEKGYVELQNDTGNKKERIIVPTAEGKSFFEEVCKGTHEIEEAVLNEMGQKSCDMYLALSEQYEMILKKNVEGIN